MISFSDIRVVKKVTIDLGVFGQPNCNENDIFKNPIFVSFGAKPDPNLTPLMLFVIMA